MQFVSYRRRGDLKIAALGDDGKSYHFINSETAANWMQANTTNLPTLASISPSTAVAGAANTTVTLTGTNFTAASEVLVNNTPVTRVYTNATTMSTILPTSTVVGAQTWQISVRNGLFQTAPKPFIFT